MTNTDNESEDRNDTEIKAEHAEDIHVPTISELVDGLATFRVRRQKIIEETQALQEDYQPVLNMLERAQSAPEDQISEDHREAITNAIAEIRGSFQ